jgi:hypothetical protein
MDFLKDGGGKGINLVISGIYIFFNIYQHLKIFLIISEDTLENNLKKKQIQLKF